VSRPEAFDLLGANALTRFAETLIINPTVLTQDTANVETDASAASTTIDEALSERAGVELRGLHAKLYVADTSARTRVWTGSANATDAAFGGNVEFLVEMEGPKARCGIDAVVGERSDGVGLRKLLEPYRPSNTDPRELTLVERLERRLDAVRRAVACLSFVATIVPAEDDTFHLNLRIASSPNARPGWWDRLLDSATFQCRPLSLGAAYLRPVVVDSTAMAVDFGTVSFDRLTSFFVIDMELHEEDVHTSAAFVINAELVGAPADRRERTLVTLLENGRALLRFLLLLLGEIGADDLADAVDIDTGDKAPQGDAWLFAQWQALFEPMVRALAIEPGRLDEIARLMHDLESTAAGNQLLPVGWREVWQPIWLARQEMRAA
jgi:hypothetical protein